MKRQDYRQDREEPASTPEDPCGASRLWSGIIMYSSTPDNSSVLLQQPASLIPVNVPQ